MKVKLYLESPAAIRDFGAVVDVETDSHPRDQLNQGRSIVAKHPDGREITIRSTRSRSWSRPKRPRSDSHHMAVPTPTLDTSVVIAAGEQNADVTELFHRARAGEFDLAAACRLDH